MTEQQFFDALRQGLWVATATAAPLLTVALVVGVVIGLLQALTAVQEATLTFVPKLAAMLATLLGGLGCRPGMLNAAKCAQVGHHASRQPARAVCP